MIYRSDNNIIVTRLKRLGVNDYGVGTMLLAGYGFLRGWDGVRDSHLSGSVAIMALGSFLAWWHEFMSITVT